MLLPLNFCMSFQRTWAFVLPQQALYWDCLQPPLSILLKDVWLCSWTMSINKIINIRYLGSQLRSQFWESRSYTDANSLSPIFIQYGCFPLSYSPTVASPLFQGSVTLTYERTISSCRFFVTVTFPPGCFPGLRYLHNFQFLGGNLCYSVLLHEMKGYFSFVKKKTFTMWIDTGTFFTTVHFNNPLHAIHFLCTNQQSMALSNDQINDVFKSSLFKI